MGQQFRLVTIMHGCNNFCLTALSPMYDVRAQPLHTIVEEVQSPPMMCQGSHLLGQKCERIRQDLQSDIDFVDLLEMAPVPGIEWIRYHIPSQGYQ